jgi:hypothetical protein
MLTILMPKTKIYARYHLSKCKEIGIEFELLEELETDRVFFNNLFDLHVLFLVNFY